MRSVDIRMDHDDLDPDAVRSRPQPGRAHPARAVRVLAAADAPQLAILNASLTSVSLGCCLTARRRIAPGCASSRLRPWSASISTGCASSSSTTMRICGASCARCCMASARARSTRRKTAPPALKPSPTTLPDIVITDWAMPIFDGLELTQMIRQPGANANPFVPIIMLTGHSEKKRVIAARDAGVTEFLAKPISAKGALPAHPQRRRQSAAVHQDQDLFRSRPAPQRQSELRRPRAAQRRQGGRDQQQPLLDKAKAPS